MKNIISPDTLRKERIPPGQHVSDHWPVLHHGGIPDIDISTRKFEMFGLVEEERGLTFDEFADLPRVRVFSDIHCVTTWSVLGNSWEGVSASVLKELVNISPEAEYAMVHAREDFTTNIPLEDLFAEDVLFAFSRNGEKLTAAHGGPVRLVVPRLYFWKSAKWVTGVEFMERNSPGFWERNGYHIRGDPWKEERYSGKRRLWLR